MKKILFFDHGFHKKTGSSAFFIEILRDRFEVEVLYLSVEGTVSADVLEASGKSDLVVLWQMDFLAPVFLAQGKPTIVIPMYDGSGGMSDLHWLLASGARQINFSLALHNRVRMLGCQSLLVRYFPKPVAESDLPRFDKLSAFFWERRPDHGIDVDLVDTLIGGEVDSLHVHNVSDVPWSRPPRQPRERHYNLTTSDWLPSKSDYNALLARANTFVAPRVCEGIGMALLEAMARGMLVLANDEPTNNEYVANWVNGVLFNRQLEAKPMHIRDCAETLGRMAWETVREGHRKWVASLPTILEWIGSAPVPPPVTINLEALLEDAWFSYYASADAYTAFLRRNVTLMTKLSGLSFAEVTKALQHREHDGAGRIDHGSAASDRASLDLAKSAAALHDQSEIQAQLMKANQEQLQTRARLKAAERALALTDEFPLAVRPPSFGVLKRLSTVYGFLAGQRPAVRRLVKQGNLRRDVRDWAGAADFYEQAVAANPRKGEIWVQLGNMRKEAGRFDLAAHAYQQALQRIPRNSDLYLQIGHLRKLTGNARGAEQAYQMALTSDRNNRDAVSELQSYANEPRDSAA